MDSEIIKRSGYHRSFKVRNIMDINNIINNLTTEYIGRNIKWYKTLDSTNTEAKRNGDMCDGTLFIADTQTNGRGRLGREWASQEGDGIFMSLLLKPGINPEEASKITLIAGIAAARAIGMDCGIKWPNDIVMGTKKVCGILTEMSMGNIICGIGINVNNQSFDEDLSYKATSMKIETGKEHKREDIIRNFANEFQPLYKQFLEEGIASIMDLYRGMCVTIGRDVTVIYPDRQFDARAVDVDNNGNLVVEVDGEKMVVSSGEVSVRGMFGYI